MIEDDETVPRAKRSGREDPEARNIPGEFADDVTPNRFTPPPDPPGKEDDESKQKSS